MQVNEERQIARAAKLKAYHERHNRIVSEFAKVIKDNALDVQTGFSDRDLAEFMLQLIHQTQILSAVTKRNDNNGSQD